MANNSLQNVGNVIQDIQYADGNTYGQELEFDPVTGTFKVVQKGTGTGDGAAINDDGFAC